MSVHRRQESLTGPSSKASSPFCTWAGKHVGSSGDHDSHTLFTAGPNVFAGHKQDPQSFCGFCCRALHFGNCYELLSEREAPHCSVSSRRLCISALPKHTFGCCNCTDCRGNRSSPLKFIPMSSASLIERDSALQAFRSSMSELI